jgi:hypothetical protein
VNPDGPGIGDSGFIASRVAERLVGASLITL